MSNLYNFSYFSLSQRFFFSSVRRWLTNHNIKLLGVRSLIRSTGSYKIGTWVVNGKTCRGRNGAITHSKLPVVAEIAIHLIDRYS